MKYSKDNPPLCCLMRQSTCYKKTTPMSKILGILIHDTGANNPTLKRYVQPDDKAPDREMWLSLLGRNTAHNDWNHITREAGVNAWVGKLQDGTVTSVQTLPWNYKPWGCGKGPKGSCNSGWIQIEVCEDTTQDESYFEAAYRELIELVAYLCRLYNLFPHGIGVHSSGVFVPTILCHQDAYRLGLGSNHEDIYDWFSLYFDDPMGRFKKDVAKLLDETPSEQPSSIIATENLDTAKYVWDRLIEEFSHPYMVAGIMGNLEAESGMRCDNLEDIYERKWGVSDAEYTRQVNAGVRDFIHDKAGYGLAQWTYHIHKEQLLQMTRDLGLPIDSCRGQVEYLINSIKDDAKLLKHLLASSSIREATRIFLEEYEKPTLIDGAVLSLRTNYAEEYYRKFKPDDEMMYIVRRSWGDGASQLGIYPTFLQAIEVAKGQPGYCVFDEIGVQFWPPITYPVKSYCVRVVKEIGIYPKPIEEEGCSGTASKGVYTITEESNGYGKLKSGRGWIKLGDTQRLLFI